MSKATQEIGIAGLLALLAGTLVLYWPGLDGPLILDDISNLGRLESMGPIQNSSDLFRFIFSGSTSYPLRPLSFASFLINDIDWPLYAPSHKYTSVLVHLINGALVLWLALLLCRAANVASRQAVYISLTATALWLLAPLQVSTVLYLIQRMTSLSALFVLGGLITYCYGRARLDARPWSGFVVMTLGVGVFGILGFLCKENAVLLTLYVLAIEHTLLKAHFPVRDPGVRRYFVSWQWIVLAAPVVLAFAFLIARGALDGYDYRPFTSFERIASQPRIVFDYLQNLLIPIRHGMGVTHDDYVLSTGVLTPPTTVIAMAGLVAAVAAALWLARKGSTLFGFAVLWFVSGHVLESSVLPLEPYFEHRNYLPAFGPLFALAYFVWTTRIRLAGYLKVGLGLYLACFVLVTKQNVDIWSSRVLMGEVWARDHPRSVRAQQIRADVWSRTGQRKEAQEIIQAIAEAQPNAMGAQVQNLLAACRADPGNIDRYLNQTVSRIPHTHFDHGAIPALVKLKDAYQTRCPALSADELLRIIDTLLDQQSVAIRSKAVGNLLYLRATILAGKGELQNAVAHLYAAFNKRPSYGIGLASVLYLYQLGEYKQALSALEDVKAIDLPPWHPDNFRTKEIAEWRDRIQMKLEAASQ